MSHMYLHIIYHINKTSEWTAFCNIGPSICILYFLSYLYICLCYLYDCLYVSTLKIIFIYIYILGDHVLTIMGMNNLEKNAGFSKSGVYLVDIVG